MFFSDALKVRLAEEYFGQRTDYLTRQEIRDLRHIGPDPDDNRPNDAVPVGVSHRYGLIFLISSPNLLPVHRTPEALRYKMALMEFDASPYPYDKSLTNGQAKQIAIRLFYHVYDKECDHHIYQHKIVGGKNSKITYRYGWHKTMLACSIIHLMCYGTCMSRNQRDKLSEHGKHSYNKLYHNFFARTIALFFCQEMNPFGELDYEDMMTMNVGDAQEHLIKVTKFCGIWLHTIILPRAKANSWDPDCFTKEDKDVCKGTPYEFARLAAMMVDGFDFAEDDQKNYWTEEERRALFKPLDKKYCYPRYPPVKHRLLEYGAHYLGLKK